MEEEFPEHYTLADEIGRGAFFVNKRCIDLRDSIEYAAKIIDLNKLAKIGIPAEKDILEEIRICQKLKHKHIIELYHASREGKIIYVVRELVTGVDLCYEIINKVNQGYVYSEVVASHYMRQVLEGLEYIHDNAVIHRDMKPHNITVAVGVESAPIKVGEFGIAIELPEPSAYIQSGRIGTPHFMAPEVVKREPYGCKVDVWGCGVILFILLGGSFPFGGHGQQTFEAIVKGDYKEKMETSEWTFISDTAKELIECLLEVDPEKRFSATEALQHPWLSDRDQFAEKLHLEGAVNALKQFNARRKLKGAVLATMASRKLTNGLFANTKARPKADSMDVYQEPKAKGSDVTEALESFDTVKDMFTEILDGIDESVMADDNLTYLRCMLQNKKLRSLMNIYSLSRDTKSTMNIDNNRKNAEECLYEVGVLLNSLNEVDHTVQNLKDILSKPHVKSLLKTHDDIIKEVKGQNNNYQKAPIVEEESKNLTNQGTELMTRVRLVQFPKSPNEPMGITLKKTIKNECLVARIIYGGMIHRQGTLHVGDEIKEIDGVNVSTCSVERLQQLLRDASGDVTFKIVPGSQNEDPGNKETYFKCLFDYDPRADDLIPCQQAGLSFNCGDVIEVVSKADMHWWQARNIGSKQVVGLVPSTELQEQRIRNVAMEKKRNNAGLMCILPKKQKKKTRSKKYTARFNTAFDRLDLVTYEEVIFQNKSRRKSIVLIGAHGVGRRHIKNCLVTRFPEKYASPIPHTSRKPTDDEEDGDTWYFDDENNMLKEITSHQYLEYGKHEGSLYGTKLSTVKSIIQDHRLPILDIETPALKLIRCKEFCPYIIFISSPNSYPESGDPKMDTSLQRLVNDSVDLKTRYRHFFDYTIINNTIEETVETIVEHLEQLEHSPEWIPAAWYY